MKKLIFPALLIVLLIACNKEDHTLNSSDSELIGAWKLEAFYASPGAGPVVFEAVESNKIIVIQEDGTFYSNGGLCYMGIDSGSLTNGTYSLVDSTFQSQDCYHPDWKYRFSLDNRNLFIYYPYVCGDIAKFKKL